MAIRAFNLMANGMGGCNLAALPLVCAYLGIEDVEGALFRIEAISGHRKPAETAQ